MLGLDKSLYSESFFLGKKLHIQKQGNESKLSSVDSRHEQKEEAKEREHEETFEEIFEERFDDSKEGGSTFLEVILMRN